MFKSVIDDLPDITGMSVLDFGCGLGRLTDYLTSVKSYVGLDNDAVLVQIALDLRPGFDFRFGSLDELERADVVFCIETVQCFRDPLEAGRVVKALCATARKLAVFSSQTGMELSPQEVAEWCEPYSKRVELRLSTDADHPGNYVVYAYR